MDDVKTGNYPSEKESYGLPDDVKLSEPKTATSKT
jgi:hypothetical protein